MEYNEIAAKYKGHSKARVSKLAEIKTRIEYLKQLRENFKEVREEYRMKDGVIVEGRKENWDRLTRGKAARV